MSTTHVYSIKRKGKTVKQQQELNKTKHTDSKVSPPIQQKIKIWPVKSCAIVLRLTANIEDIYCRDKCEIVYGIIIEMPFRNDVSGDIHVYLWDES